MKKENELNELENIGLSILSQQEKCEANIIATNM
jgi:hypothetical protein